MLFNSITYIYYFLPIVLITYLIVPQKYKLYPLLVFSIIFYMYAEPKYIILLLIESIISYILGKMIYKTKDKITYIISISIHIIILILFKYSFVITKTNITLPLGISFYTFQIISYLTDIYKGKITSFNLLTYLTYMTLFPKILEGPIERYNSINKDLENNNTNFNNISRGISRFIIGLSKKVLIVGSLSELVNIIVNTPNKTTTFYILYGICYTLEIYIDFSSYTDMSIGLGKMFGINLSENFDYPLTSKSITEFWRKWHISLSSWFRDYIYIPLGGNRVNKFKQIRNILIVWLITGIWHGKTLNFILWGLYFGIILIIEKFCLKDFLEKLPNIIKRLYTLTLIVISFIIFNGNNILNNIIGMFNFSNKLIDNYSLIYLKRYFIIILISILISTKLPKNIFTKLKDNNKLNKITNILEIPILLLLLIISTSYLIDNTYNPFLYFIF